MRLVPVPIRFLDEFPERVELFVARAAESSLLTHASLQCLSSIQSIAMVVTGLMCGLDRYVVLASDLRHFHPAIETVVLSSFHRLRPPDIQGSGYGIKSFEAGRWAFRNATDFPDAVLKAVNLGDDADTAGAGCGDMERTWAMYDSEYKVDGGLNCAILRWFRLPI